MQQKELRIALVCYGGVSLAVYMHGVTKEIWHLARASRCFHSGEQPETGVAKVYHDLLKTMEEQRDVKLRVLPDILTGASAGGINAVFLAQAIYSGHSLEPLTDLWLENADVDKLLDADARPVWKFAKIWAQPIAWWLFARPGNVVSESVAPETRNEVRRKVSRLVRGRWFQPPFSGDNFSELLFNAMVTIQQSEMGAPLLPAGHPLDLLVTTTDFRGHAELLRLNSPPVVQESEHRMPICFRAETPEVSGKKLADPLELTLAARATASFPGAFPPLELKEIDRVATRNDHPWTSRQEFLNRIMPAHVKERTTQHVALIDGSVLVNAPFDSAIDALYGRPGHREVDRRFIYIDPRPDRIATLKDEVQQPIGFFASIFGSISSLPREQPIRDNLEVLEEQSRDAERLQQILAGLRPEVDRAVESLFGLTFFLDRPTPKRLKAWRAKAQQAAAEQAGYAFHSYAQVKLTGIIERLAHLIHKAAPELGLPDIDPITSVLRAELERSGLVDTAAKQGGASEEAITFFRKFDLGFRIRRLRLLARRVAHDWERDPDIPNDALDLARSEIYSVMSAYGDCNKVLIESEEFAALAQNVFTSPGAVLDFLSVEMNLIEIDEQAELRMGEILAQLPKELRRRLLFAYLGFPFYDVATLPLLRHEGMTEYDPIKVDRISPDDAPSIRDGGARATLRGIEFYNFGAFFSRAYRENDYLWGRLHGAERMIDLVCSTVEGGLPDNACVDFKRAAFEAILEEELQMSRCRPDIIKDLQAEVAAKFATD